MAQKGIALDVTGINPLEIANLRASAQAANFDCRSAVGSNVVDANGNPHLSGRHPYGAVVWNIPFVSLPGDRTKTGLEFPITSLGRFWDGDENGLEIYKLARNLDRFIAPNGVAILWNHKGLDGQPSVKEILELGGCLGSAPRIFDVREEAFPNLEGRIFSAKRAGVVSDN